MMILRAIKKIQTFSKESYQNSPIYRLSFASKIYRSLPIIPIDPWSGDSEAGLSILKGYFTIGGYRIPLKDAWTQEIKTDLVFHYLHSFAWIKDLKAIGDNSSRKITRQLISQWMKYNHTQKQKSWTPLLCAYRLNYWIFCFDFFGASSNDKFKKPFLKILIRQILFIQSRWRNSSNTYEKLICLSALITFYTVFHKTRYLKEIKDYLNKYILLIQKTINHDGGLQDISPSNTFYILKHTLDIRNLLRQAKIDPPQYLSVIIEKIAHYIRFLRHGDGRLCYFEIPPIINGQDSLVISSSMIDTALSLSDTKGKPNSSLSETGYERFSSKRNLILINAKLRPNSKWENYIHPTCQDGINLFNFEWSQGVQRIVTLADIILNDEKGEPFKFNSHHQNEDIHILRYQGDEIYSFDLRFHDKRLQIPFSFNRNLSFDLSNNILTGNDTIISQQNGIIGFRFVFDPIFTVTSHHSRNSFLITDLSDPTKQLLFTLQNSDETFHFDFEDNLGKKHPVILFLAELNTFAPKSMEWTIKNFLP